MPQPALSIVIPCRDRQVSLAELLAEIAGQCAAVPEHSVEVIVVDDASQVPLALPPGAVNARSRLIRHERATGAPGARRTGLALSRGGIVHFHDSDDLLGPGWVARVVEAFGADPGLDILVTARAVQSDPAATPQPVRPQIVQRLAGDLARLRHYQRFQNAIGPLGGVIFRAGIVHPDDLVDAPASQDWLMYDAALRRASKVSLRNDLQFVFRTFGCDRISGRARRRVEGFVFASRRRFAGRRAQRLAAILYCASAGAGVASVVNPRPAWFWRRLCRWLALSPLLSRLVVGVDPPASG